MAASRVASSAAGVQNTASGSGTIACPVSVTAGNSEIVESTSYESGGSPTTPTITKSSGSATIGTPVRDATYVPTPAFGGIYRMDVTRVPITGSGSLTLQYTSSNTLVTLGLAEYAGLDASAVLDGTPVTHDGTAATFTTGNIVTTVAGLLVGMYADASSSGAQPTYSPFSDSQLWQEPDANFVTAAAQDKITSSSGTYALTLGVSPSEDYSALGVAYKAASGGASYTLTAAQGSASLAGQAARLLRTRLFPSAFGSFALTGRAANLLRTRSMPAAQGSFSLAGQAAALTKTSLGIVIRQHKGGAAGAGATTLTITFASALLAGSFCAILAGVALASPTVTGVAFTGGGSATKVTSSDISRSSPNAVSANAWQYTATGGETAVVITASGAVSGTNRELVGFFWETTGWFAPVFDALVSDTTHSSTGSADETLPTLTPSTARGFSAAIILDGNADDFASNPTPGGDFSSGGDFENANKFACGQSAIIASTTGIVASARNNWTTSPFIGLAVNWKDNVKTLTSANGTFVVSGRTANLLRGRTLAAAQGAFVETGQSANLLFGRRLNAQSGALALSGQPANLTRSNRLVAANANLVISGQVALLLRGRILTAAQGVFTETGRAANLLYGRRLNAQAGAFVLAGQDASLRSTGRVVADVGTFALNGQTARLLRTRTFPAAAGSFTLSGKAANTLYGRRLAATSGVFVLTGVAVASVIHGLDIGELRDITHRVAVGDPIRRLTVGEPHPRVTLHAPSPLVQLDDDS